MSTIYQAPFAKYYDRFFRDKPYKKESQEIRDLITVGGIEVGSRLLDVACGTGGHAYYLAPYFDVYVQDASPDMLKLCREKLQDKVRYLGVERMESFHHRNKFDSIICMSSSIGYPDSILQVLKNFKRHLVSDGMVIFDFWNRDIVETKLKRVNVVQRGTVWKKTISRLGNLGDVNVILEVGKDRESLGFERFVIHSYTITDMLWTLQTVGFKHITIRPWYKSDLWNILVTARRG